MLSIRNTERNTPLPGNTVLRKESRRGSGLFVLLERWLGLERYFYAGFPVHYLPKVLFVLLLGLLYISNAHFAEEGTRRINRLQTEVEELRADYITLKADLMFAGKQSEVAKRVESIGLKESVTPPDKIIVEDGKY